MGIRTFGNTPNGVSLTPRFALSSSAHRRVEYDDSEGHAVEVRGSFGRATSGVRGMV